MYCGRGLPKLILASLGLGHGLFAPLALGELQQDLSASTIQYAPESSPTLTLSSRTEFVSEHFKANLLGYFEGGRQGVWSLDPLQARLRWFIDASQASEVWLGREHPWAQVRSKEVTAFSALGALWNQNQLEALNPQVAGWLGGGWVQRLQDEPGQKTRLVLAYSPIFLPTFGPSLGFSERGELNPARFARVPPENASVGGVLTPIRYQVKTDQLADLLLRHQFFVGVHHETEHWELDTTFFSAPRPDPATDISGSLAVVNAREVNARVEVNVQFPRQDWVGLRAHYKTSPLKPEIELTQNLGQFNQHLVSLQAQVPDTRIQFGFLSHFGNSQATPRFSDSLVHLSIPIKISEPLEWRTWIQGTLWGDRKSCFVRNELEWNVEKNWSVLAAVRVLAGPSGSYFGDWRSLDSVSGGLRWVL